mgnify:CR=1 FL=1
MPTGYTAYIQDGKITTGKEFLKLCTRAFGIAVDLKEESLDVPTPSSFKPNLYYKEQYKKALDERDKVYNMTFEEVKEDIVSKFNNNRARAKECLNRYKVEDNKYLKVRREVEKWIPPTTDHMKLKKFCLEQIDMSLNTGLYKYYDDVLNRELDVSDSAVRIHLTELKEDADENVKRTYKSWHKELKRTSDKNQWMRQFLDSLENL